MAAPHEPLRGAAALSPLARLRAMDPATVQRLCAESIARTRPTRAEIIPFASVVETAALDRSPPGKLQEVAALYLREPAPPNGLAKRLAAEHGVNYQCLLTKISDLRARSRFA